MATNRKPYSEMSEEELKQYMESTYSKYNGKNVGNTKEEPEAKKRTVGDRVDEGIAKGKEAGAKAKAKGEEVGAKAKAKGEELGAAAKAKGKEAMDSVKETAETTKKDGVKAGAKEAGDKVKKGAKKLPKGVKIGGGIGAALAALSLGAELLSNDEEEAKQEYLRSRM